MGILCTVNSNAQMHACTQVAVVVVVAVAVVVAVDAHARAHMHVSWCAPVRPTARTCVVVRPAMCQAAIPAALSCTCMPVQSHATFVRHRMAAALDFGLRKHDVAR